MIYRQGFVQFKESLIGSYDETADVAALERELERKLDELEAVNRRLARARRGGAANTVDDAVNVVKKACPFMSVQRPSSSFASGEAFAASDEGFDFDVWGAPFFVSNEATNECHHVTLPLNSMRLRVSKRGVSEFEIRGTMWNAVKSGLVDADGKPLSKYEGKVVVDRPFSHPHCSELATLSSNGVFSARDLCFGNNPLNSLLFEASSQAQVVLAIKAVHNWLTEVNTFSVYHSKVAPVTCDDVYYGEVIEPACAEARPRLLEFVNSEDYSRVVSELRKGREPGARRFATSAARLVKSIEGFEGTLVEEQADGFERLLWDQSSIAAAFAAIGTHQLISALVLAGVGDRYGFGVYRTSAMAICAVVAAAWTMIATDPVAMSPFLDSYSTNWETVAKFFSDWEVMKDGFGN